MFLHKLKEKKLGRAKNFCKVYWAALFLVLTGLESCGDYFFPEFKVKDSYLEEDKAIVVFSAEANPSSAMKNFLFSQDDEEVEGKLDFLGDKMFFYPKEKISENHCYKIMLYSGVQDINGNTLQNDYKKVIYTKDDLSRPCVLDIKAIEDDDKNAEALEILFNKEIDQESFAANFSIEPDADFFANWSDQNKKLLIKFKAPLLERTLYSVKIQKSLKDKANNTMQKDFYWAWTNNQFAKKPTYKIYATEYGQEQSKEVSDLYQNADFSKAIEIVFDKKMQAESLMQGIEIEPKTSFSVEPVYEKGQKLCKKAKIIFNEKPKWDSERTLSVNKSIKDASGSSVEPRRILIKNNSCKARPPRLEFVALTVEGKNYYLTAKDNFQSAIFPTEKYPSGDFKDLPIYFVFSIGSDSERIERISALEGISILSSRAGTISIERIESLSENDFSKDSAFFECAETKEMLASIKTSKTNLCALKCSTLFKNEEIDGKPSAGLIEFLADEKVCDDQKIFMEEGARLTCNKI